MPAAVVLGAELPLFSDKMALSALLLSALKADPEPFAKL
jgi:hypothetical protein